MSLGYWGFLFYPLLFCFSFCIVCIFLVTCQSLESGGPSLPRCGASVSSPSGAARQDLLCDWARAKSQQGGVKPAGMFHIHNRREYIISPSGYCGLSGWETGDFTG